MLSFDWNGEPLLTISEGKPPAPPRNVDAVTLCDWLNTPPTGRHLVSWEGEQKRILTFPDQPTAMSPFLQRFEDGWIDVMPRGGAACLRDSNGQQRGDIFNLGDAIEDVQTTPSGDIWVGYFDEGVYGGGIGQSGLVCFDAQGQAQFKYNAVAAERHLPPIDDLYAMNVVGESEIWICYYADFPIVRLERFDSFQAWPEVAAIRGLGVSEGSIFAARAYKKDELFRADLEKGMWRTSPITAVDLAGEPIAAPFTTLARRNVMGILTQTAAYVAKL
ncbi:MAG TPA: hypothetical protein VGL89_16270 [Candidatus Koribacter sp.]